MTKESSRLGRRASGRAGGNLQQITELARLTRSSKSSRGYISYVSLPSFFPSLSLIIFFTWQEFSFLFSEKERGALTRPDRFLINRFFVKTQPDIFPTRDRPSSSYHRRFRLSIRSFLVSPRTRFLSFARGGYRSEHDTGWRLPLDKAARSVARLPTYRPGTAYRVTKR